ncbi:MAG: hypothetical protein ABI990_02390 [Actinomycetota bacterium]
MRVWRHEEDPRQETHADRDDERVDEARPVSTAAALADQQEQPDDDRWEDDEVEGVRDRGERQLVPEKARIVVCQYVANDEEHLRSGEEKPWCTLRRAVDRDAGQNRRNGAQADHVEHRAAAEDRGPLQIEDPERSHRREEQPPRVRSKRTCQTVGPHDICIGKEARRRSS